MIAPNNGADGRHPPTFQPQQQFTYVEDPEETIDLRDVVGALRRNIALIAGFTIFFGVVAVVLVMNHVPQYEAKGTFRLLDERRSLTGGIEGAAIEQLGGRASDPFMSQLEILHSHHVAGAVVDRLGLRVRPESGSIGTLRMERVKVAPDSRGDTLDLSFGDGMYQARSTSGEVASAGYGEPLSIGGVTFTIVERPRELESGRLFIVPHQAAIEALVRGVRAQQRQNTDVVDVTFASADPMLSQAVVNAIIEEYRARNVATARDRSIRRRAFIEEQLAQTEAQLRQAQNQLTEFRRREGVYSLQQKFAAQQTGMIGLDVRREELVADRSMFRDLLRQLGTERGGRQDADRLRALVSAPGIASNPVVTTLYQQLVRYETTRDSLTTGDWASAASHPDVQRLESLAASTRDQLVDAVQSHVSALEARIAALDELRQRNAAELATMPAVETEEAQLVESVQAAGRLAQQLREEYQRARIAEAVEAGQVEIVDWAPVPREPIPNRNAMKIMLGLVLGAMLGSGTAFLVEQMNTSIRRREEVEQVLQLTDLGVVPNIGNGASGGRRLPVPLRRLPGRAESGGLSSNQLVALTGPRSSGAEAYRMLRTNLIFSQSIQSLKSIVVTSTAPAEGKTTTASNLAVTFAQQGMRVLLVDGDLRKGRLDKVFRVRAEPGFTNLVLGHAERCDAIRSTAVDGLYLLPQGVAPPNPAEFIGSKMTTALLDSLSGEFDIIVIDTPPIGAATDAAVLGAWADGVLMVLRVGFTGKEAARYAVQQLRAVGARIIGAVLNDPDAKIESYGTQYYGEYYAARDPEEDAAGV